MLCRTEVIKLAKETERLREIQKVCCAYNSSVLEQSEYRYRITEQLSHISALGSMEPILEIQSRNSYVILVVVCFSSFKSLLCMPDFPSFAVDRTAWTLQDASFIYLQARKKKDAEKAAIQRKAEAKKAREDAKITVASFRQFSNAPANSGLSMVWQIALPQLVAVMCKVRLSRHISFHSSISLIFLVYVSQKTLTKAPCQGLSVTNRAV